jgi:hypothetical protein
MKHDHVIDFLARKVDKVLRDNLLSASQVPDETAVRTIRSLVGASTAQLALERGSDTTRAFVVRAVNRVVSDESVPPRDALNRLRAVLDALDVPEAGRARTGHFGAGGGLHGDRCQSLI